MSHRNEKKKHVRVHSFPMILDLLREPPTHEELDRRRRLLEEERIAFEWHKLQSRRAEFESVSGPARHLLDFARSERARHLGAPTSAEPPTDHRDAPQMEGIPFGVGRRVCRYWEGSKRYFTGRVAAVKLDEGKRAYFVEYDDGDEAWESEVEDPCDPSLQVCRRSTGCWKRAGHKGVCIGVKRRPKAHITKVIAEDGASDTRLSGLVETKRARRSPFRLSNDIGWARLQSRRWSST